MGRVYLAQDEVLGRSVALKIVSERFLDQPQARQRFLREARSMATVEHPNVVRVYSFGEAEHGAYFVMEYVEGEALSERLRRGKLETDETLRILREVIDGLEAAWDENVVHRDIKPGNVLLDRKGHAHVSDFGLAKPVASDGDHSLTDTGSILGSPFYVSPEQARGLPVDHRSDIYSVGIMAFEMLAGDRPFVGTTSFEVVAKHLHEPLPDVRKRRPDVPEALARALEWMTAKEPATRPHSYAALRQTLSAPSEATPAESSATMTHFAATPQARSAPAGTRRRSWLISVLAAAFVVLGATALWRARTPSRLPIDPKQLVVAVAPFHGPDAESVAEGRTVAGLVEREVVRRLGPEGARVIGVEETRDAVRDHAAARALGERLGASVVVWGDVYAAKGETEIQPSFTLVAPAAKGRSQALRAALGGRDPSEALREISAAARPTGPQSSSQIELRKTSAAGVGDLVLVLAGMHRLYNEGNAERALALFERAPRSSQSLRHRAEALWRLGRREVALDTLNEAALLDPKDPQTHATLGDFLLESDRLVDAERELRRASELPGSYATRNGIVFEDKLYVRETFVQMQGLQKGQRLASGYLLAVDPASGRVLERHRPPGMEQLSLSVRDRVLHLDYAEPAPASATFTKGRFEKPVFYTSSLFQRRQGMISAQQLAANFLTSTGWREKPTPIVAPEAPASLEDLEALLRQATLRDSTQPWHLLFLGQALSALGRADEAQETWAALFEPERFPATPYYEYASMAHLFEERLRQPRWADRAYAEALSRRKRIPQPIEASTLIERLINAPFMAGAARASRKGDLERGYLWLIRARELSGIVAEAEALPAAAWESYFRAKRDAARAGREAEIVAITFAAPGNFDRATATFDAYSQVFLSTSVAAWMFLALVGWRARAAGGLKAWLLNLSPRERAVSLGALLLSVATLPPVVTSARRMSSLAETPLGVMDTLGGAHPISEMERRLAASDGPKLRFAAAVANHMAGNLERARELYEKLGGDSRAAKNKDALRLGVASPPEPLSARDFYEAFLESSSREWANVAPVGDWTDFRASLRLGVALNLAARLDLLFLLAVGVSYWRVPAATPREGGTEATALTRHVPGAADLARGEPVRAYLALSLLVFCTLVAAFQLSLRSKIPAMGVVSVENSSSLTRPFPLPYPPGVPLETDADAERALRSFYWVFLRARPLVAAFWASALLAGIVGMALHVHALRRPKRVGANLPGD